MGVARTTRWVAGLLAIGALTVAAGCSSDEDPRSASGEPAGDAAAHFSVRTPEELAPPPDDGDGVVAPQPSAALPEGYVEEELFVGGTATSFEAVESPADGRWAAEPDGESSYRTRVLVRRPAAQEDFSGTVLVEWFNVSAIEASPDWGYLSEEIGRSGHAYVGVSAQAQGVEGGETILDVEVDDDAADDIDPDADTSGKGLKHVDPDRYGTLEHPGDSFSFDIFSQVGKAAREMPADLLGGLRPEQVVAVGESQSAAFLSTLVNAVHPLDPTFDGFLIHSRGATTAPLDGDYTSSRRRSGDEDIAELAVRIRDDLEVPVMLFEAETDLTLLGYAHARQPDTDRIRTWEVAGTAHADAHTLRAILGGPRDASVGSLLGCDGPINTGPHHEVVQAALHHLVAWVAGGDPPPAGQLLELVDGEEVAIARDEHGNALGGVRNPLVDVPIATITGDPPGDGSIEALGSDGGVCMLFGQTVAFDRATLVELYGTADDYVAAFRASADEAVDAGFLLRDDADQLIAEAEENRSLFG